MSLMEEKTAWSYINKHKSECDIMDNEGVIFGHIGRYKTKELAKTVADGIRKVFPPIKFKLTPDPKEQNKFDLYGDYYQFWKVESKIKGEKS